MRYAKCVSNRPYLHPRHQPEQEEPLSGLTIGQVYKVLSDPIAEQHAMIRINDESFGEAGSENGYLYPADYFEPYPPTANPKPCSLTIYLDEYTKSLLHAEALASDRSISAFVRQLVVERLCLPDQERLLFDK